MDFDFIIVGAGAAGIAAARIVVSARRRALVLEARDRPGGRAFTERTALAVPIDLGASWFHQRPGNALYDLAAAQGRPLIDEAPWQSWRRLGVTAAEARAWERTYERVDAAVRAAGEAARAGARDQSAAEASAQLAGDPWYGFAVAALGGLMGAEFEDLSALDYANYMQRGGDAPDAFIRTGMGALLADLAQGLPIRFGMPVERIAFDAGGVAVVARGAVFHARQAIVTIPTSLIAAASVQFDPPLPARYVSAAAALPLGALLKVALEFREDVFDCAHDNTIVTARIAEGFAPFTIAKLFGAPVTLCFFGRGSGRALEAQGAAAAERAALAALGQMAGRDRVQAAYTGRCCVSRWDADPWSGGAYSYAKPGHAHARVTLAEPIDERLFFAGEALSVESFGTVHGAWNSGIVAARRAMGD